jgi:hypothetical protein
MSQQLKVKEALLRPLSWRDFANITLSSREDGMKNVVEGKTGDEKHLRLRPYQSSRHYFTFYKPDRRKGEGRKERRRTMKHN